MYLESFLVMAYVYRVSRTSLLTVYQLYGIESTNGKWVYNSLQSMLIQQSHKNIDTMHLHIKNTGPISSQYH